jgi:transcriptional regulator with XRE-family HTH domain
MMKDEIYLKKLGDKIVRLREEKDISQRELARRIKTNNTQIRRIETGIVNSSINMLRKIANEFDITISELVDIS